MVHNFYRRRNFKKFEKIEKNKLKKNSESLKTFRKKSVNKSQNKKYFFSVYF